MILILVCLFVFQNDISATSLSFINLRFNLNNPISETHAYDEIENAAWVESCRSIRVNRVLSKSETGSECEISVDESSYVARTSGLVAKGLGSTGLTTANNLVEQMAMKAVVKDPTIGRVLMTGMKDSRWFISIHCSVQKCN